MNNNSFIVDNSQLRLGLEFTKVDQERRIVSGFATLDNVDAHGDLITAEASREAFANFRGNIREMHGENAVGKLVSFEEASINNGEEVVNGIIVDVYVSKAAEDVWTKVQEGIFGGFSIGGIVKERASGQDEKYRSKGVTGTVITKYELFELSIVDNPANPLANVMAISKSKDNGGFIGETDVINVYKKDDVAFLSKGADVPQGFEFVEWIENTAEAVSDSVTKIAGVKQVSNGVNNYYIGTEFINKSVDTDSTTEDSLTTITDEGGNEMANDVEKTIDADEVVDTPEVAEEVVTEDDTAVEKDVAAPAALDLDDLVAKFAAKFEEVSAATQSEIVKTVEALKASFTESLDAVKGELADQLAAVETKVSEVENRVDSVEDDTATKKSLDGNIIDKEDKEDNIWAGAGFLGVDSLS